MNHTKKISKICIFLVTVLASILWVTWGITSVASHTQSEESEVYINDKLKLGLSDVVRELYQKGSESALTVAHATNVPIEDASVFVHIYVTGESGEVYAEELQELGILRVNPSKLSNLVGAIVPIDMLETVAEQPYVLYIAPPPRIIPTTPTDDALAKIGATEYVSHGFNGSGIKVAVIDIQYEGLQDRIDNGELPNDMVTQKFFADGTVTKTLSAEGGPHGVAVAEVIHKIAPKAELYLIQVQDLTVNLEAVFNYLQTEQVKIVSMSLSNFPQGRGDGQGAIYNVIDDARQNKGILLIESAGNYAEKHYSGSFLDKDNDNWHEFGKSWFVFDDEDIDIDVGADSIGIYLSWDNWGDNPLNPSSDHNYDLYLYDDDGNEIKSSLDIQNGSGDFPIERINFNPTQSGTYHIKIKKNGNFSQNHQFHLFVIGSENRWWGLSAPVQYYVKNGSISGPGDARTSIAVAAAQVSNDKLEDYSSRGPTTDGRIKPDITSYARVSVASSFPWGHVFPGTSAATPHIAGMAALLLEQNPNLDADGLENLLLSFATDKGPTGKDNSWGVGIGRLPPIDLDVNIHYPTQSAPELVGSHDNPIKTYVEVEVKRSDGSHIDSLPKTSFQIKIGNQPGNIISVRNLNNKYVLEILPPNQSSGGNYDLTITLSGTSDTKTGAILYSTVAKNSVDTMLVIDRSGSMGGTPIKNARNAASYFVAQMNIDDMVGVASFSTYARVDYPLTIITPTLGAKDEAIAAITLLNSGGSTSIGGGLEDARDQLLNFAQSNHSWAIVLLSDGKENRSPRVADILPSIVSTKIKVFTIGLGNVNESQMQNIAYQTNGLYYYTPSDLQLAEIYNAISGQVAGRQTLYNIVNQVQQGETKTETVLVDQSVEEAVFSLSWNNNSSHLDITLQTPSGKNIDSQVAQNDPNIEFVTGGTYAYYKVYQPESGNWTASVHGMTANTLSNSINAPFATVAGESYNFSTQAVTNLTLDVDFDKSDYQQGDAINLMVSLSDISPIKSAQVLAEVQRPDGVIDIIPLYDDGFHNDGNAGDGVYSNYGYYKTHNIGSYKFNVLASGHTPKGYEFIRLVSSFTVVTKSTDSDRDGMPNNWEELVGLNISVKDAYEDMESDGLTNILEYQNGTDPFSWDTDQDSLSDGYEVNTFNTDPTNEDTDFGGTGDGLELIMGLDPLNPQDDNFRKVYFPVISK